MSFSVCFLALEYFGWGKFGGIGRATRDIATGLAGRGINVSVIVPKGAAQGDLEFIDGVRVYGFPLSGYHKIGSIIGKVDADIIHSQDPTPGTLAALRNSPCSKHVMTCQNPKTREEWRRVEGFYGLRRRMFNRVFEPTLNRWIGGLDRVFCQARFITEKVESLYGLDYTPGFLPNPVRVPGEVNKKDEPRACFMGRFDGEKNPERFFELCQRFPGVKFTAAGAAHDRRRDDELRSRYGGTPNLSLPGLILGAEKEKVLRGSWVLVNTSVSECLPVSFLEAAAYGCAILSSHDPDGFASKFGFKVTGSYEEGMEWLLRDENWMKRGMEGYEFVKEHHELNNVIDLHLKVYEELLS